MNMGRVLNLIVRAQGGGAQSVLLGLSYQLAWMADSAKKAHAALVAMGAGLAFGGYKILSFLGDSLSMAEAFDKAMRPILTLTQTMPQNFDEMKNKVLSMATELPIPVNDLAEALYFIKSVVADDSDALAVLELAAKGAALAMTDVEHPAKVLRSLMVAYGGDVEDAKRWMDQLVAAVDVGAAEWDEFAARIGDTIGFAEEMGIQFDEVASLLAILTDNGYTASQAATYVRNTMMKTIKPAAASKKLFEELGIQWGEAGVQAAGGFIPYLYQIIDAVDGNEQAIADLFPRIRSLPTLFALAGDAGGTAAWVLQNVADSAGILEERFERAMDGIAQQKQRAQNMIDTIKISLGNALIPVLVELLEVITPIAKKFADWLINNPDMAKFIAITAGGVGTIMLFSGALLALVGVIGILGSMGGAGVLVALAAGVTALVTAMAGFTIGSFSVFKELQDNPQAAAKLQTSLDLISGAIDRLKSVFSEVWDLAQRAWITVFGEPEEGTPIIDTIRQFAADFFNVMGDIEEWVDDNRSEIYMFFKNIAEAIQTAGEVIDWFTGLSDKIREAWGDEGLWNVFNMENTPFESLLDAWENVKSAWNDLNETFKDITGLTIGQAFLGTFMMFLVGMFGALEGFIIFLGGIVRTVAGVINILIGYWQLMTATMRGDNWEEIWANIKEAWDTLWSGIVDTIAGVGQVIWGLAWGIFGPIFRMAEWLYEQLVGGSIIPDMVNEIESWFKKIGDFVSLFTDPFNEIVDDLSSFYESIKATFEDIYNTINRWITKAKNVISTILDPLINLATRAFAYAFTIGRNILSGFERGIDTGSPSRPERILASIGMQAEETVRQVRNAVRPMAGMLGSLAEEVGVADISPSIGIQSVSIVEHRVMFEGNLPDGMNFTAQDVADLIQQSPMARKQLSRTVRASELRDIR